MVVPPSPQQRGNALDPKSIQGLKYFRALQEMLSELHEAGTARDKAGNRQLFFDHHASLVLLYFFNPVLTSLRSIQQASELENVQRALGCSRTSLGSLSEASRVFDAELLKPMLAQLSARVGPVSQGRDAKLLAGLTAVDGSLLPAMPKMLWALWNSEDKKAARLHLHFEVFKGAPVEAEVTAGQGCEKKSLHRTLQPGRLYVMDRGYEQFRLFQAIVDIGSSFVCCVRDHITWTTLRQRPLSDADRAAGIVFDAEVDLGGKKADGVLTQPYRVVIVETEKTDKQGQPLHLVLITNRMDLTADLIALAYRYRWQIELFFRWFKCVLGCRHLLSTCQNGVEIQVYVALIASLLIMLWSGKKPTKRTFEMLCLYFQGWATLAELTAHIHKLKSLES